MSSLCCSSILRGYGVYYNTLMVITSLTTQKQHSLPHQLSSHYVKNGQHTYYRIHNIPEMIQVGDHQFVGLQVIRMWIVSMFVSWYDFCYYNGDFKSQLWQGHWPPTVHDYIIYASSQSWNFWSGCLASWLQWSLYGTHLCSWAY